MKWILYIVRCGDDSLYTGITTDLNRRINEHNGVSPGSAQLRGTARRGAAYTRARRPVTLVYHEHHPDRSAASRREWMVKRLSRQAKQNLVRAADKTRKTV